MTYYTLAHGLYAKSSHALYPSHSSPSSLLALESSLCLVLRHSAHVALRNTASFCFSTGTSDCTHYIQGRISNMLTYFPSQVTRCIRQRLTVPNRQRGVTLCTLCNVLSGVGSISNIRSGNGSQPRPSRISSIVEMSKINHRTELYESW